jgi:hypothetical protein
MVTPCRLLVNSMYSQGVNRLLLKVYKEAPTLVYMDFMCTPSTLQYTWTPGALHVHRRRSKLLAIIIIIINNKIYCNNQESNPWLHEPKLMTACH